MNLSLDYLLVFVGALFLRSLLSCHPHSGQSQPPMFGDYEAQRHWQEVTINLPIADWYRNTSDNDLDYWGLDYPPLTAYHSLVVGHVAQIIDPDFVALGTSRGMESAAHRIFMRCTVLAADLIVFLPSVWFFTKTIMQQQQSRKNVALSFALVALHPGQILIDNGHFQYNNISLGLFVLAVAFVVRDSDVLASVAFVCSLNYKQMELYHALPFFCYLLGKCFKQDSPTASATKLIGIAVAVLLTFFVIWLPFLSELELAQQVIHRLFPLARGVFEDKVANFWCSLNLVVKLKKVFDQSTMVILCLVFTLLASLPSNLLLLFRPNTHNFLLALINTSLAFFLFSFQVHEKSILLVALPVAMYAIQVEHGRYSSIISCWLLLTSTFSMFPLLYRDGLAMPTLMLTVAYLIGCLKAGFMTPVRAIVPEHKRVQPIARPIMRDNVVWSLFVVSMTFGSILLLAAWMVSPPVLLPDLWPTLISSYACLHFLGFAAYFNHLQLSPALRGEMDSWMMKKKKRN